MDESGCCPAFANLTASQAQAYERLRSALQRSGVTVSDDDDSSGGDGVGDCGSVLRAASALRYLHSVRWDHCKAHRKCLNYLAWRTTTLPQLVAFDGELQSELRSGKLVYVGSDTEGCPVLVVRTRLHDPQRSPAAVVERLMVCLLEHLIQYCMGEGVRQQQLTVILDQQGASMKNIDFAMERRVLLTVHKFYAGRVRRVVVAHSPAVLRGFFNLVLKPLLPSQYLEKVYFIRRVEELHAWVQPRQLPSFLAGTIPEAALLPQFVEEWIRAIQAHRAPQFDTSLMAFPTPTTPTVTSVLPPPTEGEENPQLSLPADPRDDSDGYYYPTTNSSSSSPPSPHQQPTNSHKKAPSSSDSVVTTYHF